MRLDYCASMNQAARLKEITKEKKHAKKILFVAPSFQSFIRKDHALLKRRFIVRSVTYSHVHKTSLLLLVPRIFEGVFWADMTFSWFGSFHAFFAVLFSKILRKKSIVVAGGYDAASMPEIGYGLFNMKLWRLFPEFSFKYCDKILAVSEYTKKEIIGNMDIASDKILVLNHGFDKSKFYPEKEKEAMVITVAKVNPRSLAVKGLANFAEAAKYLPEARFYIVGEGDPKSMQMLREKSPNNLLCRGFTAHKELAIILQRAKVYAQISAHESFGCALAEAMLCGCIPVVTSCGAIPEVVGETGYYVPYGDVRATANAIRRALEAGETVGQNARQRIVQLFSIDKRAERLVEIISSL